MVAKCSVMLLAVALLPAVAAEAAPPRKAPSRGAAMIRMEGRSYKWVRGTEKLPPELADPELLVQITVRDGDKIVLQNDSEAYWKPFSITPGNKFNAPAGGVAQGKSMTIIAHNKTDKPIILTIFDEIHSRAKMIIGVLPANSPNAAKTFDGDWSTNWGDMHLTQSGTQVTGTYSHKSGALQGSVSGGVLRFHWTQNNGKGAGKFTLGSDGNSFSGTWNYNDDPDAAGSSWTGSRKSPVKK